MLKVYRINVIYSLTPPPPPKRECFLHSIKHWQLWTAPKEWHPFIVYLYFVYPQLHDACDHFTSNHQFALHFVDEFVKQYLDEEVIPDILIDVLSREFKTMVSTMVTFYLSQLWIYLYIFCLGDSRGFTHNWMSVIIGSGGVVVGVSTFFKSLGIWDKPWYHILGSEGSEINHGIIYIMLSHESPWHPPHFPVSRFSKFSFFTFWQFILIWLEYKRKWP